MTAMVGYGTQGSCQLNMRFQKIEWRTNTNFAGRAVFTFRHQYWIWGPIIGSCCGGLVAGLLYDLLIYNGPDSFVNRP
jgi:hypothetical protein